MPELQADPCDVTPPEKEVPSDERDAPDLELTSADTMTDGASAADSFEPRIRSTRRLFKEWAEWLTALSTFALVIYTAILAHYAYTQTDLLNKQLVRIDRSLAQTDTLITNANSQSKSSQIQAEEAIKANIQNYKNAVVQLRPYMSFGHLVFAKESDLFPSTIEIKNAGQTPAIHTIYRTRMMIANLDSIQKVLTSGLDTVIPPANEDTAQLIGGGDTVSAILNKDRLHDEDLQFQEIEGFSDAELLDYRTGRKVLWISGAAFYDNVFDEQSRVRFCYIVKSITHAINRCQSNNDLAFSNRRR